MRPDLGLQMLHLLWPEGEPPETMDAGDGADEVRVAHVGQRAEVSLVAALLADLAPRPHPLPDFALFWRHVEVVARAFEVLEGGLLCAP